MNSISVRVADWQKDNADLRRIREKVFIAEQAVPPELEWDTEDAQAVHFLAYEGDYAIGTARLLPDGQIGRVSVLKDWRGLHEQRLSAQVQATPFYERHGFRILSEEYLDAGIPHVDMLRQQSS